MSFSLKVIASAAIVSVALAGATLAQTTAATSPMPHTPSLTELTVDLGLTPDMVTRGQQLQADMVKFGYDEDDVDDWCASKRSIRDGLVRAGFNDADIVDRMTQFRVRVEALHLADGWVYSMLINRCTGEVTALAPIYMASDLA
jgi:hypothetical protein